ncbi:MAG TPA: hypothetical protein VFF26_03565 [Gallionella sp.]|nr:hypothetical protein [Gallionella sp.]
MSGPDLLLQNVGRLRSRMGAAYPGSHAIFRGHDLHADLKDMDWVELYVFGITGRRYTKEQLRLMHSIWTYTSYPDVRIWNNRVAALAGSSRSTGNLGIAAALAVSEASIYGGGCYARSISFLIRTQQRLNGGSTLFDCIREELDTYRIIKGYGRPLVNGDERNPHILALAQSLGLDQGPHLQLSFAIEEALPAFQLNLKMNYAGLVAGLMADIGFSPQEFYLFMFPAFLAGMPQGFIEAAERSEGTLYPVPCNGIRYEGQSPRAWSGTSRKQK